MAGEEQEDVELRDLVAQTLETQGVLGKIRVSLYINYETKHIPNVIILT